MHVSRHITRNSHLRLTSNRHDGKLEVGLPFELRSKIFLHCPPSDGRVRPNPEEIPLLLIQICRRWRAVALATPELWSSIFFEFTGGVSYDGLSSLFAYDIPPTFHSTTALVDLWFSRSCGYSLSITLRCENGARLPHGLMGVLNTRSLQWERLELNLSRVDFFVSGSFPCLRSLAMDVDADLHEELP